MTPEDEKKLFELEQQLDIPYKDRYYNKDDKRNYPAEEPVKNCNIHDVSNSVKIALLKQLEELSDYIPAEIYTKKVIEIQSNFNDC